jgi:magnesium-transporting ATPase (P-type)
MIERTVIGALVMGCVSLTAFYYMLQMGWAVEAARNAILLLMVLFENVHLGNCRSETRSAFTLSPLRSPFLMAGALLAFSIHLLSMYTPIGQKILSTQAINLETGLTLFALALSILIIMEIHKWTWNKRHP